MEATRVAWFLNGYHSANGNFVVGKGDAECHQVKYQVEHGAQPETRATRRKRRFENAVQAAPEGSGHQRSPGAGAPARAGGEEVERSGRAGVPLPLPQPG